MTWVPAADVDQPPRVGYAVGKVVGNAFTRNKVRRRLQAAVAAVAVDLGPGAYLIGAGPGGALATYAELAASLEAALVALPSPGGLRAAPPRALSGAA